jgi:hypothetical protein
MAVARMLSQSAPPAAGAEAEAVEPPPQEPGAPHLWANAIAAGLVLIGWPIAMSFARDGSAVQHVEGLTAFALFYVVAFAIERLMEPVVSLERFTPVKDEKERDRHLARARTVTGAGQNVELGAAAAAQSRIARWRADRALIVFGVATVLGMFAAAKLGLYFLEAVGVVPGTVEKHWQVLVTGLVVGGGTKPLHDLLTRIQRSKDNAKDPKEVSG